MSSRLDAEIQRLKKQADKLRAEAKLQATALLSHPDAAQHLLAAAPPPLRDRRERQAAHDARNAYRACAGVTAFRARDPDPAAVDAGRVLGLRFEVMRSAGRFLRPFYVLLNRPWASSSSSSTTAQSSSSSSSSSNSRYLRVHRHTFPPAIPLAGLAARYLPPPAKGAAATAGGRREQDLGAFVRHVRREVVRYHHRLGAVADMRAAAGVDGGPARGKTSKNNKGSKEHDDDDDDEDGGSRQESAGQDGSDIVDIQPADTAAMQIRLDWSDGRVGRLVLGPDGEVRRCAVVGPDGARDRLAELDIAGGCVRVEEVVAKLRKGGA